MSKNNDSLRDDRSVVVWGDITTMQESISGKLDDISNKLELITNLIYDSASELRESMSALEESTENSVSDVRKDISEVMIKISYIEETMDKHIGIDPDFGVPHPLSDAGSNTN